MQNNSHLYNAAVLVTNCISNNLTRVVISPGSRSAPLAILFSSQKECRYHVVVDERSAAFFAMGLAMKTGKPVALVCTSGTASLNYSPALAEAYYLQVPLLVLTADRPLEWLNHAEGQQIDQTGVYSNFTAASFTYDTSLPTEKLQKIFPAAFEKLSTSSQPVHINIPIDEPLYNLENLISLQVKGGQVILPQAKHQFNTKVLDDSLLAGSILIVIGVYPPNDNLNEIIDKLSRFGNITIISETTSNLRGDNIIRNPDLLFPSLKEQQKVNLRPGLLITIGTHFLSKHLKTFLRTYTPQQHWHINPFGFFPDTFRVLSQKIWADPVLVLNTIHEKLKKNGAVFSDKWRKHTNTINHKLNAIPLTEWSEFLAFNICYRAIPENSVLHLGNSMPVRYAQYLSARTDLDYFSNRGTSGIDGSMSTAMGFAITDKKQHTLILGDLSFMYDSNALWQDELPANLKIIILNNGGGGIFRFIPGPEKYSGFERTFLARHNRNFRHIAKQFNIAYFYATNKGELLSELNGFYNYDGIAILEITTNEKTNSEILKSYIQKFSE